MPNLSDLKPLSNHELIAQIRGLSAALSTVGSTLELGLLKVELCRRAKPIKSSFSQASSKPGPNDLMGDDLKTYETDSSLRLNEADAKALAANMDQLSFLDRLTVQGALSISLGFQEARNLMQANKTKDWKSSARQITQKMFIIFVIIAAMYFYQRYKAGL